MINIVGTGLSGLVGSRIVELLADDYSFHNLSLETGVDITDKAVVNGAIGSSDAPWVFHFAAKTDVDSAELERAQGTNGSFWAVNVEATQTVVDACKAWHKRLLYISTDYVFGGTKEEYSEEDTPDPKSWYGMTKYEGEQRVLSLQEQGLVIRIANPYRAGWVGKKDFVHKILERLEKNESIVAPTDQIFVPTYIDDIAYAISFLVTHNAHGIYHVVGQVALSPFRAVGAISAIYGYTTAHIRETTFAEYFVGRAPRPLHANLKNVKITKCGIRMSSFEEGLVKMHKIERSMP